MILTISGSAQLSSTNTNLLKALSNLLPDKTFVHYAELINLPLFQVEKNQSPFPDEVLKWREVVKSADAVIISTPEYVHNIPAVLKNALEWLTASGELHEKKVLAITYVPASPRGEHAMQSLVWSLQAMKATVVATLPLYQTGLSVVDGKIAGKEEDVELLKEAIGLL